MSGGPREQVADAMRDCHIVYGERAGMLVMGIDRFWTIVGQLRRREGSCISDIPKKKNVMFGLAILVVSHYPDVLLAVPESMVEGVRKRLGG